MVDGVPLDAVQPRVAVSPQRAAQGGPQVGVADALLRDVGLEPGEITEERRVGLAFPLHGVAGRILVLPVAIPAAVGDKTRWCSVIFAWKT